MRSELFWDFSHRKMVVFTDVSVQPIGPSFKGQAVQAERTPRRVKSRKSPNLIYTMAKA